MRRSLLTLTSLLVALSAGACFKDGVLELPSMALEVAKHDAQQYEVSFSARVANWDGATPIHYQALACSAAGDYFLCSGVPFFETSVVSERVEQPVAWSSDQCGLLLVFQASLPNGDNGEATHVTCS